MTKRMTTISVKVPIPLAARLTATAAHRRVKKSRLVREALETALNGRRRSGPRTFAAVAGDLVGCITGPADLSSNPRHLRGFGR